MTSVSTDRRFGVNSGAAVKVPVKAATTAAITLSGEQTIDGVSCVTDDRVLVKDQASSVANGIYTVDTSSWSRATDFDATYDVVEGTLVHVNQGTTNGESMWRVGTSGTITIDTSSISFERAVVNDASSITVTQSGIAAITDPVAETIQAKIARGVPFEPQDFMTAAQKSDVAAYTYTLNVSTPLLNFFNACISNKHHGYIGPGGYLITKGTLAFDNAHVDTPWPLIETAGYEAVQFKATANTDAPFISITNGTAVSGAGNYWRGGKLGGITFTDSSGATATGAHGLLLRGLEHVEFGYMHGSTLRASVIYIDAELYDTTNPDPYHVFGCKFEGAFAETCEGFALNNDNYIGFVGNEVFELRATGCTNSSGGLLRGIGADNVFHILTAGSCAGWAIDDRTTSTGGFSLHSKFGVGELDNVENGIRINTAKNIDFGSLRFVHRHQTTPNTDDEYWPREAMNVGPSTPNINDIRISMDHRIESGGLEAELGEYINMNSAGANIRGLDVTMRIDDQASFGIPDADLYTGFNGNSRVRIVRDGDVVLDYGRSPKALARVTAAQNVPTTAGVCIFEVELYDNYAAYDTTAGTYTTPQAGFYEVTAQISVTGQADGDRFILTIEQGGVGVAASYNYAVGTGINSFRVSRVIDCSAGDVLAVKSVTNNASPVAMQVGGDFTFLEVKKWDAR